MSKFKVGDRVYCPVRSGKIQELAHTGLDIYPIRVLGVVCTAEGKSSADSRVPILFHATQENHELLSKLYPNVAFEKPKAVGSDLTRQKLAEGAKEVLCWVSNISDDDATTRPVVSVVKELTGDGVFKGICFCWKYAVPIPRNHYTMDDSDE